MERQLTGSESTQNRNGSQFGLGEIVLSRRAGSVTQTERTSVVTPCIHTPSIAYVREISIRYRGPRRRAVKITSASDASEFLNCVQIDNAREHFMALFLDGAHQVIGYATIGLADLRFQAVGGGY